MKADDVYKKMLEDRIENINFTLEHIKVRLDEDAIDYMEYLYIESNLYRDLLDCQRELDVLKRGAVGCQI